MFRVSGFSFFFLTLMGVFLGQASGLRCVQGLTGLLGD